MKGDTVQVLLGACFIRAISLPSTVQYPSQPAVIFIERVAACTQLCVLLGIVRKEVTYHPRSGETAFVSLSYYMHILTSSSHACSESMGQSSGWVGHSNLVIQLDVVGSITATL